MSRALRWFRGAVLAACAVAVALASPAPAVSGSKPDDPLAETRRRGDAYSAMMQAMMAARRGEFREAAAEVRRAVELQPDSPEVHIEGAEMMQRMGRRSEAIDLARSAYELDPDRAPALRFLADRAAEDTLTDSQPDPVRRAEAVRLYERLIEIGEGDEQVLGRLSTLRMQAGDREGAIATARELVELVPGDRRAVGTLAQLLLEGGREAEALEIVLGYLARHPDDPLLGGLADELTRKLDGWGTVVRVFDEQEVTSPIPGPAGRLRGEALLQTGDMSRAVAQLEHSLDAEPGDPTLRYHVARTYRRQGRLADAVAVLERLVDDSQGIPAAHARLLLGETLEDQGDVDSAIRVFQEAVAVFAAQDDEAYSTLRDTIRRRIALLEIQQGRTDVARRLIDAVEGQAHPETRELQARLAIADEDWAVAKRAVRALEETGQLGLAALIDGEIQARTGRWSKAADRFQEAVREIGVLTRVRAADICLDHGGPELAEQLIREWVTMAPDLADAHYYMGYVLFRQERFAEAEVELRESFRLDPDHAPALNFLGYSMAERADRLDEALLLIQRALHQDGWNGAYLDSLGWVYYQLGRYDEAREPLERAAREYPNDATVLEHLGDLYVRLGEGEMALAAWERALLVGSSADDAEALRGKIADERGRGAVASDPEAPGRRLRGSEVTDRP